MLKTILSTAFALFACATLFSQQQYYSVKFPDDRTIVGCGATADTSDRPIIQYYSSCNFNVGVSVKDQVFKLNATGGCKKILRTWKLVYWCDYNPNWPGPTVIPNPDNTDIGPAVIGNSLNHGYLQYTQIIKVIDNAPPQFLNCPSTPVLFCDYSDNDPAQYGARCEGPVNLNVKVTDVCSKSDITLSYRLYLDLDGNGTMETYRTSSAPDAWPIEKTITADTVSGKIKLPSGVGLPYGTHKVEWIANDGCGNQSICKYEFIVKDCKAPSLTCIYGLSVNIMPTGMITLWASDFLLYYSDNCTPHDLIKIAIRKAGTGTGFPDFNTSVTFDCNEIGQQFVEVWAQDAGGNADFCSSFIKVQDPNGFCVPNGPITGNIFTEKQAAVPGAKVLLKSNLAAINKQSSGVSDEQGHFQFAAAPGTCNYSLVPQLDTLPQLGVNTLDALLAAQHVGGQELLNTPYKIIAADVNHDNKVDNIDVDVIGNLIVGNITQWPNNSSWRFVPQAFNFSNPQLPLAATFPEKISTVCPAPSGVNQHFFGIKTGDLDISALDIDPNDRTGDEKTAIFTLENQRFMPGDEITATLLSPELGEWLGLQFTLDVSPDMLELVSAEPLLNAKAGLSAGNNRVAFSWFTQAGENSGNRPALRLKFRALQQGSLKKALQFSHLVARSEAYDVARHRNAATLEFVQPPAQVLNSNQLSVFPNPSNGPLKVSFYLSQPGDITLQLFDVNGNAVAQRAQQLGAGWQQVDMETGAAQPGVYFLQLQSAQGRETKRVVKSEK